MAVQKFLGYSGKLPLMGYLLVKWSLNCKEALLSRYQALTRLYPLKFVTCFLTEIKTASYSISVAPGLLDNHPLDFLFKYFYFRLVLFPVIKNI